MSRRGGGRQQRGGHASPQTSLEPAQRTPHEHPALYGALHGHPDGSWRPSARGAPHTRAQSTSEPSQSSSSSPPTPSPFDPRWQASWDQSVPQGGVLYVRSWYTTIASQNSASTTFQPKISPNPPNPPPIPPRSPTDVTSTNQSTYANDWGGCGGIGYICGPSYSTTHHTYTFFYSSLYILPLIYPIPPEEI